MHESTRYLKQDAVHVATRFAYPSSNELAWTQTNACLHRWDGSGQRALGTRLQSGWHTFGATLLRLLGLGHAVDLMVSVKHDPWSGHPEVQYLGSV